MLAFTQLESAMAQETEEGKGNKEKITKLTEKMQTIFTGEMEDLAKE